LGQVQFKPQHLVVVYCALPRLAMADIENKYYHVSLDGVDSHPVSSRGWFKVGVALIGGSCLIILSFVASSVSPTTLHSASAAGSTSLISSSLRMNPLQQTGATGVQRGAFSQPLSTCDTGLGEIKKYAMKQWVTSIRSSRMRDTSIKSTSELQDIQATKDEAEAAKAEMDKMEAAVKFKAQDMAGVTGPLGFFDPVGFSTDASKGKILFYREVELKHGRVCMLASLGILVAEQFHPLFGGNIDVPSYLAFQQTPLQKFWPAVLLAMAIPEVFSVFTFESPFGMNIMDQVWKIKPDHQPGDLGFDPLGLKPKDAAELKELQTKEINNGRLAMIAAAGMLAQELATGKKLF